LSTSTVLPFGIRVMTSVSVPGPLRRFTSAVTVADFAEASTTDSAPMIAAAAAMRTMLMPSSLV